MIFKNKKAAVNLMFAVLAGVIGVALWFMMSNGLANNLEKSATNLFQVFA